MSNTDTVRRTFRVNEKIVTVDMSVRDGMTREQLIALAYPDGIGERVRVWWFGGDDNRPIRDGSRLFLGNSCYIEVIPISRM